MKLTEYAHGGGCGCKIAPDLLKKILADLQPISDINLLVGFDQSDDAAVYKINDETAIVATTDFITPVVDDPFISLRLNVFISAQYLFNLYSQT